MTMGSRGHRAIMWGSAAVLFVLLMLITPRIPQDQSYHKFADRRNFYGWALTYSVPVLSLVIESSPYSLSCVLSCLDFDTRKFWDHHEICMVMCRDIDSGPFGMRMP